MLKKIATLTSTSALYSWSKIHLVPPNITGILHDIGDKLLEQPVFKALFLTGHVVTPDDFYSRHQLKIRVTGILKIETHCQNKLRSPSTMAFEALTGSIFWEKIWY